MQLTCVIVGGGVAGLTTALHLAREGHKVIVLESSKEPSNAGAGIQITPNATRVLLDLGLGALLHQYGVKPKSLVFRRYASGALLGCQNVENIEEEHGTPYYSIHRGQLVQCLLDAAMQSSNIQIHFSTDICSINPGAVETTPFVTSVNGAVFKADVIFGADGIRSLTRRFVTGSQDRPLDTGDAAYRAIIPSRFMLSDPELAPLITNPEVTCWLGPGRHIVGYCITGQTEYNIALAHPDTQLDESWELKGSADRMREEYQGWEPRVLKLLSLVESTYKWKLVDRLPLQNWVHSYGRVVLIGDACHPMLPYRAQGAAMAMEDAAVIGQLFARVSSGTEVPELLRTFQELRSTRCAAAQQASRMNQKIHHLPDGDLQRVRDLQLGQVSIEEHDRKVVFDYDAASEVRSWRERSKSKTSQGMA